MRILAAASANAPARIVAAVATGLAAMAAAALAVRPDMAAMPMAMLHGLVVGFGL